MSAHTSPHDRVLQPEEREALEKFIRSRFAYKAFTDKVYRLLTFHFSHIAHYDRDGFYQEWFTHSPLCPRCSKPLDQANNRWQTYILTYEARNDVERAIQTLVRFYTPTSELPTTRST